VIIAYTDGGCRGNPGGVGAWAFVLVDARTRVALERAGGEPSTTNNRMEIRGAIEALRALSRAGSTIRIHSDSKYLIDCATKWMPGWKKKGWSRGKEPLKNLDLLKDLDALLAQHRVSWQWVPGHAGLVGNEHVDRLANEAMDRIEVQREADHERRFTWESALPT
jgi:ribonuclease HI